MGGTRSIEIRTLQQTRAKAAPHLFLAAYSAEKSAIKSENTLEHRYNASAR